MVTSKDSTRIIKLGELAVINGLLIRMPFQVFYRGFIGVRYTEYNIHQMNSDNTQKALSDLGFNR